VICTIREDTRTPQAINIGKDGSWQDRHPTPDWPVGVWIVRVEGRENQDRRGGFNI